ncbi:CHAT domain-containing protein [Nonomuraea sp. CA-218870]|uniref:CHAT domain-containing protein n=1 Tax=Nonomuraea sp. CA-218870 TaxID=3239998 RepID=UPI003D902F63
MKDPAGTLAARIEEFERAADPRLVLDDAALDDAGEAMLACSGDARDAAVWRLVGALHLARYRLDPEERDEAAVAGVFFAAVAVLDPDGLPARLRGPHVPADGSAETWAGLAEQVFRHVDVDAYPHVGLLLHAILRRALAAPTADVCDRLGRVLLEEALNVPEPAWAAEALAILGDGMVRLHATTGDGGALDDAVHVLFRAALADSVHVTDLAAALGHALPGDTALIRAHLLAAGRPPGPERSAALLDLLDLAGARASDSRADGDLLALLRVGQACLDHWHEIGAHPEVLSRYGAALVEWYVVTGDVRSLEAGRDMLAALPPTHDWRAAVAWQAPAGPGMPGPGRWAELMTYLGSPEAGRSVRPDDPAIRLDLLGLRHWRRYGKTADPADLEIAVQTLRQAVVRAPDRHPERPAFLTDLAAVLTHRATTTSRLGPEVPSAGSEDGWSAAAPRGVSPAGPDRLGPGGAPAGSGDAWSRLSAAWPAGANPVVSAAVSAARAAVAACPAGHPQRARALLLLGQALCLGLTSRTAAEAEAALREALAAENDPRFLAEAYAVLSDVLRRRATAAGDQPSARPADQGPAGPVERGVAGVGDGEEPVRLDSNGGGPLAGRFADLDEAVRAAREAADMAHLAAKAHAALIPDPAAPPSADPPASKDGPPPRPATLPTPATAPGSATPPGPATHQGPAGTPGSVTHPGQAGTPGLVTAPGLVVPPGPRVPPVLVKGLLTRFVVRGDERDLVEALELAGDVTGGDPELTSLLRLAVGGLDRAPDATQAEAATRLALMVDDEETIQDLLRLGERHATASAAPANSPAGRDRAGAVAAGEFLLGAASGMAGRGRGRTAVGLLERAAQAFAEAGEAARTADAYSLMGREHEELGAWEAALRAFERAADGYRALGRAGEEAARRAAMGDACAGAGEPRRAAACYQRAADLCREAGLDVDEAAYQERAAFAYLDAGDHAAALERAGRARELHLARGDAERAARALVPGARAGAALGHLPAAAELISTCASELEAIGKWDDACQALDGHALLLYDLGHADHAAACEAAIVDVVRRRGRRRDPADEWYHIARRRLSRGDVPGARRAFERAERAYNQLGHQDGVAAVRHHLGVIGFTGAGMEQAAQDFGTAADAFAAMGDPEREAAARTLRAACLVELRRYEEASAELDRAAGPAVAQGDVAALFSIALVRAGAELRSGHQDRARDRLRAALGLAAGDPLREAVVHERLAAVHADDPASAAEHLGLAVDGFRATGRTGQAALVSLRLGFALEERGDLRRARKALEEGLSTAVTVPEGDAPYEVIPAGVADPAVLVRLAELQFAAGEVARGRAALAQALAAVRRGGEDPALAERLAERVRIEDAEEAGDLPGALALARQAASEARDPGRRSALLAKLCALALAAGDPQAAYTYAARGCDLRDDLLAEHLRGRGAAAGALGRTAEAIGHLTEAVRVARESGQAMPVRLVAALGALGAALAEDRRWADAGAVLAEALALAAGPAWRGMRASLLATRAGTRSRQGDADEAAALYREALALGEAAGDDATVATACRELARMHAAGGERDSAVRLAERALGIDRARGRQRAVVRDLIALGRLGDGDRLAEALSLARRIAFAEGQAVALAELGALDLRAGRFTAARDHASAAVDLLEAASRPGPDTPGHAGAYTTAGEAGGEPASAYATTREAGEELAGAYATRAVAREELGDLAEALADAERAADLHDPRSAAAGTLRAQAVRLAVRLGRAATAWSHAERARESFPGPEDEVARAVGEDARRLAGVLPEATGVLAFHVGDRVSVVAHRDGWEGPRVFGTSAGPELLAEFAATAGDGGRAELWRVVADLLLGDAVEALGDDLDVLYLLPHGRLHGLPLHALAPDGRPLLDRYAVAYAPSAATLARLALRRTRHGGRSLVAGEGEEAEAAAAALGVPPVTVSARDLEGVWGAVHLACRAAYDGADPYASALLLPGGPLTARALAELRIEARLVSVGGCEQAPAGAGATALGHALLRAGASAALLPQWPVRPEVARTLLPSFHAGLATGGPGKALRAAMLESRERYGASRPDLWAPYALIGLAA